MKKQKIALLLVIALLIQLIPIMPEGISMAFAFKTKTQNYDGTVLFVKDPYYGLSWTEYRTLENLPPSTPYYITIQGNRFYFNIETWADKGIVVYGSYENIPSNDFKNATGHLDAKGKYVETPNKGYYENGTGEYRFHGFDGSGNKFTNGDFPIDQESGNKASSKNWIYRIWEQTSPYFNPDKLKYPSSFNRAAMGEIKDYLPEDMETVRKWINEGLPFELNNTTNVTDKNAYNYAHVLSPSTTMFGGEVGMYHYRPDLATKVWYQVFTLDTIKQKVITPVVAKVEILSKNDELVSQSAAVTYEVKVTGKLNDDDLFDGKDSKGVADKGLYDEVLKSSRYHRGDIDSWTFTLKDQITNELRTVTLKKDEKNTGSAQFTITIPYEKYKNMVSADKPILNVIFSGVAICNFDTGEKSSDDDYADTENSPIENINTNEVPVPKIVKPKVPDAPKFEAPNEMLDTEKFHVVETLDPTSNYEKTVLLNGQKLSDTDAEKFLSGNWLFPLIEADKLYSYSVFYVEGEREFEFTNYVLVYSTKPRAQFKVTGTFKENRLIEAKTDVANVNSQYLMANATIEQMHFYASNLEGSDALIKYGTQTEDQLSFIVKATTQINIQMQNTAIIQPSKIERNDIPEGYFDSEVFNYKLYTQEDYKPALIANVWNSLLTRNEKLDFYYDAASVDQDNISVSTYKILYDSNSDGTPEAIIKQGNYADYTEYKPSALGKYKLVFYAEETFGQPTLSQFITAADKRTFTMEREFLVDNLAPMTKVYTDIEYEFPIVDVIVLNDQEISRDLNNSIVSNRVNWTNGLRQSGVEGNVQVWDCHTYVYSQDASTNVNFGTSQPSPTTPYSSGGYTGTLSLYSTKNNPWQDDQGYYEDQPISMTVSQEETNSGSADYEKKSGSWVLINSYEDNGLSQLPSSIDYNDGTYSGTLSKGSPSGVASDDGMPSGGSNGDTYTRSTTWYCTYRGTVRGTKSVYVSKYVSIDDYTGYYSGKIYKNVKQEFTPTLRNRADKYIVYFADANVNNKADIEKIKASGTFKLILIGKSSVKSQYTYNYYIDSNQPLTTIMSEVNKIIGTNNPSENKQTVLVNQTFNLAKSDYDDEKDPITEIGYEVVHNPNYYDNSQGLETGTRSAFSDVNTSFSNVPRTSFSKPGMYSIYRKVKDVPVGKATFSKDSNIAKLDIYVHRRPIADFTLDWDYNPSTSSYKTSWVDLSYDLDHQYTDAQRGIRERKIMYRKTSGDNVWIYSIPDNLTPGTYELRYMVKDIEGAWSDEKTKTFTLDPEAPMQFKAEMRSKNATIPLTKFTVGNDVEWFDVWSRFPYAHRLEISLWDGSTKVNAVPTKTIYYSTSTASKSGNDYTWNNITFNIPKGAGLQDKTYQVKIEAISNTNASNRASVTRNVTLINNTAPTVTFTAQSPSTVYEGDAIRNTILPIDTDGDRLTVQYFVAKPGQSFTLFKTYTNVQQGIPFVLDDVVNCDAGNYQFRVIVNDGNGGEGQANKTVPVNPFMITAALLLPNDPMAGDMLYFNVSTTGFVDKVEIILENEMVRNDLRESMGYKKVNYVGNSLIFPISPIALTSNNTYEYIAWVTTPQSVTLKGVRNRTPYTFIVRAWRGSRYKDVVITRDIKGDVRQTLKMGK